MYTEIQVAEQSFLNFDPNGFIKADILNRDVQRDGGLQSILYFTDDINPPRKINVDRAIAGDYEDLGVIQEAIRLELHQGRSD